MCRFSFVIFFSLCVSINNGLNNSYCQLTCENFYQTVPHTVCDRAEKKCEPDPRCGPEFMVIDLTDDDRQYILDIHNYLRNKVATGHEKRGRQPRASNMQVMVLVESGIKHCVIVMINDE